MTGFVSAVREDGTLRTTVVGAVVLGFVFRFVLSEPWTDTAIVVVGASLASLAIAYVDHHDVPTARRHLAFGGLLAVGGGAWLATSLASPPALAVLGVVVGVWLVLDGWTTRRYDLPGASETRGSELPDNFDDGFVANVRAFHELGAVGRAIDDGSRTPAEIAARLDRPEADVRDELDSLVDAGLVERMAGEYRLTGTDWRVWSWPRRIAGRVTRPVALLVGGRRN